MKSFQHEFLTFAEEATTKLSELFDALPDVTPPVILSIPSDKKRKRTGESDAKQPDNPWKDYLKKFAKFIGKPENSSRALRILWIISVVALLMITAILLLISKAVFASYNHGIILADIFWAIFFGGCILLFLDPKVITAAFGSFLGTSLSEVGTASGLITKANQAITNIATEIGAMGDVTSSQTNQPATDPFVAQALWIFVIIVTLLCLPAFFRKSED